MENEIQDNQYEKYEKPLKRHLILLIVSESVFLLAILFIMFVSFLKCKIKESGEVIFSTNFSAFTIVKSIFSEADITSVSFADVGMVLLFMLLIVSFIYTVIAIVKHSLYLSKLDDYTMLFYDEIKEARVILSRTGAAPISRYSINKNNIEYKEQIRKFKKELKKETDKKIYNVIVSNSLIFSYSGVALFALFFGILSSEIAGNVIGSDLSINLLTACSYRDLLINHPSINMYILLPIIPVVISVIFFCGCERIIKTVYEIMYEQTKEQKDSDNPENIVEDNKSTEEKNDI